MINHPRIVVGVGNIDDGVRPLSTGPRIGNLRGRRRGGPRSGHEDDRVSAVGVALLAGLIIAFGRRGRSGRGIVVRRHPEARDRRASRGRQTPGSTVACQQRTAPAWAPSFADHAVALGGRVPMRWHDYHWACGIADALLGYRAEHLLKPVTVTVTSDHEKIGVSRCGGEHVARAPLDDVA